MTCIRSEIIGHGHYQPAKVLTNDDMAKIVETSDEWITERTGIKSRHIAADGELTSDLALHAAEMALKNAGIGAEELGCHRHRNAGQYVSCRCHQNCRQARLPSWCARF